MGGNGWTIDWMKITVDGVEADATLNQYNYTGTLNWDASQAANPSEHYSSARAQISRPNPPYGRITMQLSSLNASPQGDGRMADFIVADLKLKSLKYNSPITLLNHAPPLAGYSVPVPQWTWPQVGDGYMTDNAPVAFVRNTVPTFTLELYPTNGNATTGFDISLTAGPFTGQPLTLYLTTGVQAANFPVTLTSQATLYNHVTRYGTALNYLHLYVQFSRTGAWSWVGPTYNNYLGRLYALLNTPTEPMTQPWVPVLDYACIWADGCEDSASAEQHLTHGAYDNCSYNGGNQAHTDTSDDATETFYLYDFLYQQTALRGQCNDLADFMVCLAHSIGAGNLRSQRSAALADMVMPMFLTNDILTAHQQDTSAKRQLPWLYHQWTNDTLIYDATLQFVDASNNKIRADGMAGPATGTTYYTWLIQAVYHPWNPQSPFLPTIENSPPP
jgi:hypothetical protein